MSTSRSLSPQLSNAVQGSLDAFQGLADIMFNASEQMLNLNLEAARELCGQLGAQEVPGTIEEMAAQFQRSVSAQHESLARASRYLHQLQQIYFNTNAEVSELGNRNFHGLGSAVQALFVEMSKLGPVLMQAPAEDVPAKERKKR